ncbi:MAG: hypothetical protein ACRC5A_13590 [Enterobacteriaceae bacterium]
MRTSAIKISENQQVIQTVYHNWLKLKPVTHYILKASIAVGGGVILLASFLGKSLYLLDGERLSWWTWFTIVYGLFFIVITYSYLLRACYQASSKFKEIAIVEIALGWIVFIPLLWYSLTHSVPQLFFIAGVISEIFMTLWLHIAMRRPNRQKGDIPVINGDT